MRAFYTLSLSLQRYMKGAGLIRCNDLTLSLCPRGGVWGGGGKIG